MSPSNQLIIIGLIFNTVASVAALYPLLKNTWSVDDDYIIKMDEKGNYTQKKHLKDKKLGIFSFSLFALGFILQIIGIIVGTY